MSDYVKAKVIRLPFPKSLLEKYDTEDPWDCEDHLRQTLGELYTGRYDLKNKYFEIEGTDKAHYLDYVLEYEYGAAAGDYGYAFLLNENDVSTYKPIFDLLKVDYNVEDLRKVVYSYYNCCECTDYYDINESSFENL